MNSVVEEPAPGADTLGWYVAPGASREDPSVRQEIPGGTTVEYDEETQEVRTIYHGTGSPTSNTGEFRGGSAIQPPNVRVNVTATAPAGTQLNTTLAGSLPANPGSVPWPDATLQTTTRVTALVIVSITTVAYCSVVADQAPAVVSSTMVVGDDEVPPVATIASPVDGGKYVIGQDVTAEFSCDDGQFGTGTEECSADVDGAPVANGAQLDTSTPGTYSFTVTATDGAGNTGTTSVTYEVGDNSNPVADAGEPKDVPVGMPATLDGTGSTDPDGPPPQTLTYLWEQVGGTPVTLDDATSATPSFTAPAEAGELTFQLTVEDGAGGSDTDTVTVTVTENVAPLADAGPEQNDRRSLQTVTLDASGSTDPDGHDLTYSWVQVSGHPAELSDTSSVSPSFSVPLAPDFVYPHALVFQVTASDGFGGTDVDTVTVNVNPTTPTVSTPSRSPSGTVRVGQVITWSTNVTNPDGYPLAYEWQLSRDQANFQPPAGTNPDAHGTFELTGESPAMRLPSVSRTSSNGPRVQVRVSTAGEVQELPLVSNWSSQSSTFAVATSWSRPVANAGAAQTVAAGSTVTLEGSGTQAQGNPVAFQWTQTGGPEVTLDDATSATPSFTAPAEASSLTFELVVTDTVNPIAGSGNNGNTSLPSSVPVTVIQDAPVADAGEDISGVTVGETATLDGTGSTSSGGELTYAWTQVSGPEVTLDDATSSSPSFTAPAGPAELVFSLVVNDGSSDSEADEVTVSVANSSPVADAGADQSGIQAGETVALDGSGSSDPDGHELTYSWQQLAGPDVELDDESSATPSFTAPAGPAMLTFVLSVTDGHDGIDSATVTVQIDAAPNQAPVGSLVLDPTSGEAPLTVSADASGSFDPDGEIVLYSYSMTGTTVGGDPVDEGPYETPDETTGEFVIQEAGSYTVTLVVTDDGGLTDTVSVDVEVTEPGTNEAPTAVIAADPTSGTAPLEVAFDGSGSSDPDGEIVSMSGTSVTATRVRARTCRTPMRPLAPTRSR